MICRSLLYIYSSVCTNWPYQVMALNIKKKCVCMDRCVCVTSDGYTRGSNFLIMLLTGLGMLHLTNKPVCFISEPLLTPSSHLFRPFPPGTSSHIKYRAASSEEEWEEVPVKSEMQMATEDMTTSQPGTSATSNCQFIHKTLNVNPWLNNYTVYLDTYTASKVTHSCTHFYTNTLLFP